jgi:outer membrane protein OmpA-like peptidoglycan-associated protein
VRRNEAPSEEQQPEEDNAGNNEDNDGNRRRVRREEGEQSEERPERRARRARQQEEGEQGEGENQQAQTDERQERLRRLEEERLRALKEAEERRDNVNDRRRRELTDQEQGRRERAKRITEGQDDENRQRRVRRLEAIQGGESSQEERKERRRLRREFTDETLGDVKRARRERREGDRVIIEEPGNRRIIREGRRIRIEEDDSDRLRAGRDVKTERGTRGRTRTVITRGNGVQIITVRNEEGDIVRRIKRLENGREVVLFSNEPKRKRRPRRDGGDGFSFFIDLPDFRVERSRRDYYLYADVADEEEMYDVLSGEPLEEFEEDYTLEEIRYSPDIRARLRKLNVNTVNFDFGSWEIREDQYEKLEVVARVINRIIERDESEVFLIGGHTDLVGTEEDNLSLSGRRSETVARILTDEFAVPPENLVTQGYGESDPLVDTIQAEAANRRVEFMRITPALAQNEE